MTLLSFPFSLVPDSNNFTIITDSTSYTITLTLNEVSSPHVLVQNFTIYISPNELKNGVNLFTFLLKEPGGALSSFMLEKADSGVLEKSGTVETVDNALLTTSNSDLEVSIHKLTLLVYPFVHSTSIELVNFTVIIVEGKVNLVK